MKVKARMCLPVGSIASNKSNSFFILKPKIPKLPKPSYLKKPEPTPPQKKTSTFKTFVSRCILYPELKNLLPS